MSTIGQPVPIQGATGTNSRVPDPLVSSKTNCSLQNRCFLNLLYHSELAWFTGA
jgi:hypothetical protein